MNIIEMKNVTKTFENKKVKTKALRGINFQLEKGELLSIVGTSGSGKTTLLNIIGLLEEKTKGKYSLVGKKIEDIKEKEMAKYRNEYFGFVVQEFALINDFKVKDNIVLPLEYREEKISKKEKDKRVRDIANKLGIGDKLNQVVKNLSGGQKQRVAIARALINDPEVILADEPTGALDKKTTLEILEIFVKLNLEGKSIILITHDEEVASISNRTLKLEDGVFINEAL